jgi:hypothetical protein
VISIEEARTTMTSSRNVAVRRPTLNFIVDYVGFTAFVLLMASGVLMRYVLPPGSGRWSTVWGLDRHEWGSIHFWFAVGFLSILTLHLYLHWRWILTVLRGRPREGSGARIALGTAGLVALLALAVAPFLSPVERTGGAARAPASHSSGVERSESIRGSMTLAEIQEATGVPADHIIEELGLPAGIQTDERLGRLKRTYGFAIDDVRRIVAAYRERLDAARPR